MAQQSLYRRYRPRRFSELRGQDHVAKALRHAVASGTEGHAYLFSGPRGTGKTSTARILAKALNCTALDDGEPCGSCDSCVAMDAGTSYDLFELDAASNNGVDAVRDLISRTAVGSPGRTKVYILDEVHMLSTAASNALLKTLEEPPDHVVFVLATTDPQKVLPTIRSRTQHFEFSLLSADELTEHVRWVIEDAGLELDPEVIPEVVRMGKGSARDTLSALDRVVALGGLEHHGHRSDELLQALAERHTGDAVAAIASAIASGVEPRTIGETLIGQLRDAFLVAVKADTPHLTVDDRAAAAEVASRFGTAGITRALELVGTALVDMRQATDQRIPLEVAVVRLCHVEADDSTAALADRLARLERAVRGEGSLPPAVQPPPPAPSVGEEAASPSGRSGAPSRPAGAAGARAQLSARRGAASGAPPAPAPATAEGAPPSTPRAPSAPPKPGAAPAAPSSAPAAPAPTSDAPAAPAPAPAPPASSAPAAPAAPAPSTPPAAPSGGNLTLDGAQQALDHVIESVLRGAVKAIYKTARLVEVDGPTVTLALANAPTLERAERSRAEVEAALAARAGAAIQLRLVDDAAGGQRAAAPGRAAPAAADPPAEEHEEVIDVSELDDAPPPAATGVERIQQAFPGATLVEGDAR